MTCIHRLLIPVYLLLVAAVLPLLAQSLETPLKVEQVDTATFAQWVDGVETPVADNLTKAVYTKTTQTGWNGINFGANTAPGVRHLRVGFTEPLEVGTVIVQAGGKLSVLKADAVYPGDLGDDTQWITAQRLVNGKVSTDEVAKNNYGVWVLPAGTKTRAIRFSQNIGATDREFIGWLGGMYLLTDRMTNLGPQAITVTKNNDQKSNLIVNEAEDSWGTWENWNDATTQAITPLHPEPITLIWPKKVTLNGIDAFWCGFGAATVQEYVGPDTTHPREATEADWKTIKEFTGLENKYPSPLPINVLDFGKAVTTRAIRVLATAPTVSRHPHLDGNTNDGKRIWLGELMALQQLGTAELASAVISTNDLPAAHPPIPIKFKLIKDSYVTLVIEDENGNRVRNLVSATLFPAGLNTTWWDGMDDLGRDVGAASHGLYSVPGTFVKPGNFKVRGLYRQAIDLAYEFSVYNSGSPAWLTADGTGSWMSNHTPPSCSLFVPADGTAGSKPLVFLGSYVSEGTNGLIWVDLDGKKVGGVNWIGGHWTAAQFLGRDTGAKAAPGNPIYIASAFDSELRLTERTKGVDRAIIKYKFENNDLAVVSGMAVHDGIIVCSLPKLKLLLFVDVKTGAILGKTTRENLRGLAFDDKGQLLILDGKRLLRVAMPTDLSAPFPIPAVVIGKDLEDPQNITFDSKGNIYVSDRGASHQVKVFSAAGTFIRAIGKPGIPKAGKYDPLKMHNPNGITIDSNDHLWVAETDYQPKRVSVWTLDGKAVNAFYGPSEYGGGGALDPKDKTRFYYGGMVFKLDWDKGTNVVESVLLRPQPGELDRPDGYGSGGYPETALYLKDQRYYTNCYSSNPTNGTSIAMLWKEKNGIAVPVAAIGNANSWSILKGDTFKTKWPAGIDLKGDYWQNQAMFVWSDTNADGKIQPEEVTFQKKSTGGVTVMSDLSFVISRVDGKTMQYLPIALNDGIPSYDLNAGKELAKDVQPSASSGGDQALVNANGWTVMSLAPKPFSAYSLTGVKDGKPMWSYPNLWPGLHASHEAPTPQFSGEIIGATRLMGGFIKPTAGDAGPIWTINGNMGNNYMLTTDGLFVAQLFQDVRMGKPWAMPRGDRNMLLNEVTCSDENFWPSITQTGDGKVYLNDGARSSIIRVDGLDTIRRFPNMPLTVTVEDMKKAQAFVLDQEVARQQNAGKTIMQVAIRQAPITVDGLFDDWKGADWVSIDKRGVAANFNSNSKPYDVKGSVAVVGDKLYAAFGTADANLLNNTGELLTAIFKTGGALDLMIGTDPKANSARTEPVAGDIRVLVTMVKNKPVAMLYRAVVPGTTDPEKFSSPWRTITIDQVVNISDKVQLAVGKEGNYEISIPLSALQLTATDGMSIKGDIGILRGDGMKTVQRSYWSNKATGITADVPSEAMLTPQLWGTWRFATTP